jgi:hypothetical protein
MMYFDTNHLFDRWAVFGAQALQLQLHPGFTAKESAAGIQVMTRLASWALFRANTIDLME